MALADDKEFQTAVSVADVDGVSIVTVLDERDELMTAARYARAVVSSRRQEEQQAR